MLLNCMGETSEDVLDTTGIEEKDKEDYDKVIKQLGDHFQVRKNLIMDRAHFNTMKRMKNQWNSSSLRFIESQVVANLEP